MLLGTAFRLSAGYSQRPLRLIVRSFFYGAVDCERNVRPNFKQNPPPPPEHADLHIIYIDISNKKMATVAFTRPALRRLLFGFVQPNGRARRCLNTRGPIKRPDFRVQTTRGLLST